MKQCILSFTTGDLTQGICYEGFTPAGFSVSRYRAITHGCRDNNRYLVGDPGKDFTRVPWVLTSGS